MGRGGRSGRFPGREVRVGRRGRHHGRSSPRSQRLLSRDPGLVRARSTVVTHHDPPVHGATLLHYVAANGVEGYRQKSPTNAVAVATRLLEAGAEPDALAGMYGGQCTTMSMLVSSSPPAEAGVQVALVDTLVDHGASVEARGSGPWTSPLMTALAFSGSGTPPRRSCGAGRGLRPWPRPPGWGGSPRRAGCSQAASPEDRHRALALAAQHGHLEIVRLLLDAGDGKVEGDGFVVGSHHFKEE